MCSVEARLRHTTWPQPGHSERILLSGSHTLNKESLLAKSCLTQ